MIAAARSPPVTKDIHFSYSAMSLYQMCPLRFAFRYIHRLPEHIVSASAITGGAVHSCLEAHYRELLVGHAPPSLGTLLAVFWDSWRNLDGVKIRFNKGEDINDIGRLAERVLRAFQASDLAHPKGTIIGIEETLRGIAVPGVPDIVARIDLMLETDAEVIVQDFKTARSSWGHEHVEDAGVQLLLYHELVKPLAGNKPIRLEFAVFTKTKVPEITVHQVEPDPKKIARTKKIVERVWRAIEHNAFYPAPSPMNCPTCPYRQQCRAWTG